VFSVDAFFARNIADVRALSEWNAVLLIFRPRRHHASVERDQARRHPGGAHDPAGAHLRLVAGKFLAA